jgi:hypothetical protein
MKQVLTEALKSMLNGLAHQDAGEFLTPREKTARLSKGPALSEAQMVREEPVKPAEVSRRRVALFMGRELKADVVEYVKETCARLEHDLTVLTFESEAVGQALLNPYRESMNAAGIDTKLVALSGNTINQLVRYLNQHPEIAFLTCKESGYLGRSYLANNQKKNELPVPVVVIVERDKAAEMPDTDTANGDQVSKIA